ncbi:hypothetical protein B0A50_00440 [Salinomyces thailandicus]|uniref:Uncharacterized protein n=1 Tax=Salinomyces thailandicus TaxID=706561 RepID=A0A4U0UDX0_9PEZI|nr:hypothetical protein B0A50_00440 [Salinomyces thailandica]
MAFHRPVVLEAIGTTDFVRYVLDQHNGPSLLVVCDTKDAFLKALRDPDASHFQARSNQRDEDDQDTSLHGADVPSFEQSWATPTLRMLATSRTVKMAFCPDITHLRAYLATFASRTMERSTADQSAMGEPRKFLALLNPIAQHRLTSAFSAQGLNRTFAAAVEAAYHTGSQLIVAECLAIDPRLEADGITIPGLDDQPMYDERSPPESIWDEQVSILNVTTKNFGAGERGWVGRTVKVRDIAGRWCRFQKWHAGELEGTEFVAPPRPPPAPRDGAQKVCHALLLPTAVYMMQKNRYHRPEPNNS